jgi:thiosulfate/3-mercaptopyruvate sulfurtransferase
MKTHPFYPDVLVSKEHVFDLVKEGAHLVQVDLDPAAFGHGHVPGAASWNWKTQLRNSETHEAITKEETAALLGATGIGPDTPVILYGDNNNWFACWALWLMRMYGHQNVRLLDGGLRTWIAAGFPLSSETTPIEAVPYQSNAEPDLKNKAVTEDVFAAFFSPQTHCLVDVRSSAEFEGRILSAGLGTEDTCEVAGHIPNAINVPWNLNCKSDGTFKAPNELNELYASFGISPDKTVITYCAIGERASLSWFVLKLLLGYTVVLNYDRSMAYWSQLANAPIQKGVAA